jgi:hypothetical protein
MVVGHLRHKLETEAGGPGQKALDLSLRAIRVTYAASNEETLGATRIIGAGHRRLFRFDPGDAVIGYWVHDHGSDDAGGTDPVDHNNRAPEEYEAAAAARSQR